MRPTIRPFALLGPVLVLLLTTSAPARADLAPSCDSTSALVTCAAADVGKACQGGGKCFEVPCASSAGASAKVYKCIACATIIAAPAGTCTISNMGSSCSDGDGGTGTCGAIAGECNTTSDKFVCQVPSTETPTGPPGGGGGSSGCDVAPRATPGAIGVGLVIVGFIFVVVERVRRRRR